MSIETKYLAKNQTYTSPKKIKAIGECIHSTGLGYKSKDVLFGSWNKPTVKKSCHGMVDDVGSYLTLPLNYKGWHCGSTGNDIFVGFEICEPPNIVYADKNHTKIDTARYNPKDPSIVADFERRYNNAVALAAKWAKELDIDPENIKSHAEWHKEGKASNHADVGHWFPLFGKSMDTFREDVKRLLRVRYRVQVGAFKNEFYAKAYAIVVKAKGFSVTCVTYDGQYYRVQIGSFANKDYAVSMCDCAKEAGLSAIIKEE